MSTAAQQKCWRNDAYAKVTGKAKFTDDLKFANVLHAAPVYSDFVHARINAIDTSAAEKVAGVVSKNVNATLHAAAHRQARDNHELRHTTEMLAQ